MWFGALRASTKLADTFNDKVLRCWWCSQSARIAAFWQNIKEKCSTKVSFTMFDGKQTATDDRVHDLLAAGFKKISNACSYASGSNVTPEDDEDTEIVSHAMSLPRSAWPYLSQQKEIFYQSTSLFLASIFLSSPLNSFVL
jgi:hypothetical protein